MKRLPALLLVLLAPFPLFAADDPCVGSYAFVQAVLWQQTSAEYEAITREVYGAARRNLDAAISGPLGAGDALGRKPAIITDIDETALDTSTAQVRMMRNREVFGSGARWNDFALHDVSRPIPAALDFFQYAASRGVSIFYVTNREAPDQKAPILATLSHYGYPMADETHVLLKGERPEWTSDKTSRRTFVASQYAVLMLFGDDLNDFLDTSKMDIDTRRQAVADNAAKLGTVWYVLPNPVYGSWDRALGVKDNKGDCGLADRLKALREDTQWH
jgi:5'-nucleotidase (lipoprotein e(P4) family)